ncbi:hypothetical protein Leryth_025453 [Lithospermum erythrorhizon]|nr:hypothetical protein Leryth_025453 [Lithospermum erythrorhizon]
MSKDSREDVQDPNIEDAGRHMKYEDGLRWLPMLEFPQGCGLSMAPSTSFRQFQCDIFDYETLRRQYRSLIRYIPGGRVVKQHLGYFPSLQLSATVSPITRTVLKIDLIMALTYGVKIQASSRTHQRQDTAG